MQYGKWEVIKTLGQGGQGVAYLVNDTNQLQLSTLATQMSNSIAALGDVKYEQQEAASIMASATLKKLLTLWDASHIMRIIHDCPIAPPHTHSQDDPDRAAL